MRRVVARTGAVALAVAALALVGLTSWGGGAQDAPSAATPSAPDTAPTPNPAGGSAGSAASGARPDVPPPTDDGASDDPAPPAPTSGPTPGAGDARTADQRLAAVYALHGLSVPGGPVEQPGCPPPPAEPGGGGGGPPWHPPHTVPESELPAPSDPAPWASSVAPFTGKGMWVWQYSKSEGGDLQAVVDRAVAADLEQLWVRVADSRYGFYAAEELAELVPAAHAAGLEVIGWGFPFLHDPVGDAAWTRQVLDWRAPNGDRLDAFSPDLELETEGVVMTPTRVAVYLDLIRQDAGDLPLAATVYPPADWVLERGYPYETMARYVDAFVPMDYWMCVEPGGYAQRSLERLRDLRPVHVIGQAFHNERHGRRVPPSGDETLRFLDTAVREGAIGASLWVWQDIGPEQWQALARYPWPGAAAAVARGSGADAGR